MPSNGPEHKGGDKTPNSRLCLQLTFPETNNRYPGFRAAALSHGGLALSAGWCSTVVLRCHGLDPVLRFHTRLRGHYYFQHGDGQEAWGSGT